MKSIVNRVARLHEPLLWRAVPSRSLSSRPLIQNVTQVDVSHENIDIQRFKELAFDAGKPLLLKGSDDGCARMPATEKWFQPVEDHHKSPVTDTGTPYFEGFAMAHVPYELMHPQLHDGTGNVISRFMDFLESGGHDSSRATLDRALASHLRHHLRMAGAGAAEPRVAGLQQQRLLHFEAPLGLLLAALRYNAQTESPSVRLRQLYVAQCHLSDLPPALSRDLPAPRTVSSAGRGDIYASSVWLGLEPTYTPLHRDPNPNLFVQLRGAKAVRLLAPGPGDAVFRCVRTRLGCLGVGSSSRIRGTEMMEGPERVLLHGAVWGDEPQAKPMQEARLAPGDALFIPKGWWHSVRSRFEDGRLNGSVNWWFR